MEEKLLSASDARKQWKELLDRAVQGEVIKIVRGGVVFYLGTSEGMQKGQLRVVDAAVSLGESIAEHKRNSEDWVEASPPRNATPFPSGVNHAMPAPIEAVKRYAVIIEETGHIVKDGYATREEAEAAMEGKDPGGQMVVKEY